MRYLLIAGLLLLASHQAYAGQGEITAKPICASLINKAPYKVYGDVSTDKFAAPDGTSVHHRRTFALAPNEKMEICAQGPFFPGRKVELTLRTLFPIFSCQTTLDSDIIIQGREKPEGGTETTATCH